MKKRFNPDPKEKLAIEAWTNDSNPYKKYMWWGDEENPDVKPISETLFNLFEKYESNVEIGQIVYRGMALSQEEYDQYEFANIRVGVRYSLDMLAITSFTKSEEIATAFADDDEKEYAIIFILNNDQSLIDISDYSSWPGEEETILSKNKWYNVINIDDFVEEGKKWKIISLEPPIA